MKGLMAWNDLQASIRETADETWSEGEKGEGFGFFPGPTGESAAGLAHWVTKALGSALLEKKIDPKGLNTRVYHVSAGPSGTRWYVDIVFPEVLAPSLWGFVREKLGDGNFSGTAYGGKVSFQFYPLGGAGNTAVTHF